jgi:nitrite reductase/ring-hydroxylating ferredoxin subunit/uncharacterized membrane protein
VELRSAVSGIAERSELDAPADAIAGLVRRAVPDGAVKDALHGTWLGEPLHPVLTDVTIGAWTSAFVVEIVGGRAGRRAARTLIGVGVLSALPTAAAGLTDWLELGPEERRVGLVHLGVNTAALGLYAASYLARRRAEPVRGFVLGLLGAGVATVGAHLGGHLVYGRGAGVDHSLDDRGPEEWTTVPPVPGDRGMVAADADGQPVVLVRDEAGTHALGARCSHLGGPLGEGALVGGCIECPWHGSRFDVRDGCVRRGPATAPQPVLDVRAQGDGLEVRRAAAG